MKRIAFGALLACFIVGHCEYTWGAVGRTAAVFGVSQTGAAQYSIPIFAPGGTAGMAPSLSLTYSSTAGDGVAGAGFMIGGLSQIARCNGTVEQNGAASSPRLESTDRLCLDGVQLRLVSGTYGVAGSTYRTELESFTRITAYGSAGNGPAYFIAELKNGTIREFGNSADSRIESLASSGSQVTTARAWALNKIRDRAGNAIELTYVEDLTYGAFRPSELRWTSNPAQGLSAAYKIVFVYEPAPRPDTLYGYRLGNRSTVSGQIAETRRLDRIDVLHNTTTVVRRYELTYEAAGGAGARSRLKSVQECGLGGTDCLAATTFTWIDGTLSWNAEANTGQSVPAQPLVMDINNDGRDDLVYSSTTTAGTGVWLYMLAIASGYSAPVSTGQPNHAFTQAMPLDWDGDGREDFIAPNASGQWVVFRANGNGFDAPVGTGISSASNIGSQWWTADVDGDGRGDLIHAVNASEVGVEVYARHSTGTGFGTESLLVQIYSGSGVTTMRSNAFGGIGTRMRSSTRRPDFNGDGREDFVILTTTYLERDPPNPPPIINTLCEVMPGKPGAACLTVGTGSTALPQSWLMGDATGDGLTDLFYVYNNTAYLAQSRGEWPAAATTTTFSPYAADLARAADWDGDGRDDLIAPNSSTGTLWVSRSTGAALSSFVDTGLGAGATGFASVGDMNGDGLPDLLRQNSSGAWLYSVHRGAPADKLRDATDAHGNSVAFEYASLAQSNYMRSSSAVYPEQDDQRPRYVVSRYTASNGVGGSYSVSHSYYGGLFHARGRGFEGFQTVRTVDSRKGFYEDNFYQQRFPFTGRLDRKELRQSDSAKLISRLQNKWSTQEYGTVPDTRALPYLAGATLTRYEVGGAYNGALLTTTTTTNLVEPATGTVYDSTTVTTEAAGANGASAGQSHTQRTWHSTLFTDTSNWCIGQPSTTQQINSHTAYGGAALTRTSNTTWDGANCRPTQLISQPGDSKWQVTTALAYDAFGNVNSQTVTGAGMAPRKTTINWGETGQFPSTVTNPLAQPTKTDWDAALGVRARQTDPNGIATSWQYDGFGRVLRETRPDGTANTWAYNSCSSLGCVNANNTTVVVATLLDASGTPIRDQYEYFDRFDRPLLMREQTLSGADNRVEREYDAQGRVYREAAPCWWVSCTSATSFWTRYAYDAIDRLIQITQPANDHSGVTACTPTDPSPPCQSSYVRYDGLAIRIVDAEGEQTTKTFDASGLLRRTVDAVGLGITYDYDPFSQLLRVTDDAAGTTVLQSFAYNVNGSRLASTDADMGAWSYTPNALGEITSQRDANGAVTAFAYDALGRMISRTVPSAGGSITSTFAWGASSAAKNIGKLEWQGISGTSITAYRETYVYDSIGRPVQTRYVAGSTNHDVQAEYSASTGLLRSLTYPLSTSGYRFKLRYDYRYGQLSQVSQFDTGTRYWLANASDPRGNIVDETLGHPTDMPALLRSVSSYDDVTGLLQSLQTGPGGNTVAQNLTYQWNGVGSLVLRQDNGKALTERFYYDNAHRLDYSTLNGTKNLDLTYDTRGNVTSKTGMGTYTYGATRPHAVSSIKNATGMLSYRYDANGNMTNRAGNSIAWFASNLPKTVSIDSSHSSSFQYTPYGQRWQHTYRAGSVAESTVYIGSLMEQVVSGGVTRYKHYIHANGKPVAFYFRDSLGASGRYTMLRDHLGSTDAFHSTNGSLKLKESFDAFGKRRGTRWGGDPSASDAATIPSLTRRGFTNHEHLDSTALVHMNGRLYDPALARFLSADPYVANPESAQAFNRYSYVGNDPLSFTDPTGFLETVTLLKHDDPSSFWSGYEEGRGPCKACPTPNMIWRDVPRASLQTVIEQMMRSPRPRIYFARPSIDSCSRGDCHSAAPLAPMKTPVPHESLPEAPLRGGVSDLILNVLEWAGGDGQCVIGDQPTYCGSPDLLGGIGRMRAGIKAAESVLSDDALVCRGGKCTAKRFIAGTATSTDEAGRLQGVSVNSAAGKTLEELTVGIPNGQVGVTTVGTVRAAGGEILASPSATNPYHCTLCGITPEQAQKLFTPTIPNPGR